MPNNIISFYRNNYRNIYHATLVFELETKKQLPFLWQKMTQIVFQFIVLCIGWCKKVYFDVQRLGFCHFSSFSTDECGVPV